MKNTTHRYRKLHDINLDEHTHTHTTPKYIISKLPKTMIKINHKSIQKSKQIFKNTIVQETKIRINKDFSLEIL